MDSQSFIERNSLKKNSLTARLFNTWQQAVLNNKIVNQFEAQQDDLDHRWQRGDRILYGVKYLDHQFTYYACNLTQNFEIADSIEQRPIADTGGYFCILNGYRTLRPSDGYPSIGRQPDIPSAPHTCRFYCQNPVHPLSLLNREPLLNVPLPHFTWNAYYNAAPLQPEGHFLWIPTQPENSLPHWLQQLTPALIEDALALFAQVSDVILYFNGLHAGASVNHIHFQAVYHTQALPVESAPVKDYKDYQLLTNCLIEPAVFSAERSDQLIHYVEALQRCGLPFNLLMASNRVLVIAKDSAHEIVAELHPNGMAALEVCGAITVSDRATFTSLNASRLKQALQKMVVPASQVIDQLEKTIE